MPRQLTSRLALTTCVVLVLAAHAQPTLAAHAQPTLAAHAQPTLAAHGQPTLAAHAQSTLAAHAQPTLAAHALPALAVAAAQPAPAPSQPAPTAPDGSAQPGTDAAQPTVDEAQPTTDVAQPAASAQPAAASAAVAPAEAPPEAHDDEIGDQAVAAELGLAGGGRVTPGGLRIVGHYLYQLSDRDWFDGAATFTFGSGQAACFRNRMDSRICSHGIGDGVEVEVAASVRRVFAPQGAFRPFARVGLGVGLVQFGDDDVSGGALTLHGGGGVRVKVAPAIAVLAEGDLALGLGSFSNGVGGEPQLGLAVTAGVEFRLR